jgi:predicted transcriptional regulator
MERFPEGYTKIQGGKMKVKNIRVAIKSERELFEEVKEIWGKLEGGGKVKKHEAIYFESLDAMRRVLTEERLRILKVIKKQHPGSIYELAKILKRDLKNTFNDVQFLVQAGLVDLKKTKDVREKTTPLVNYDKILLEIAV